MLGGLILTVTLYSSFQTTQQFTQSNRLPYSINGLLLLPEDVIQTGELKSNISVCEKQKHYSMFAQTEALCGRPGQNSNHLWGCSYRDVLQSLPLSY